VTVPLNSFFVVAETLTILLGKASAMLKPFLPQLQTTFLKALNDTNRTVRLKAGLEKNPAQWGFLGFLGFFGF
jgi:hypothetical protein